MINIDKRYSQRDLFKPYLSEVGFKCSFAIDYYPSPDFLVKGKSVPICLYTFPSQRSAVAWLFYNMPNIFYFEIKVVNEPVNCPSQYLTFE